MPRTASSAKYFVIGVSAKNSAPVLAWISARRCLPVVSMKVTPRRSIESFLEPQLLQLGVEGSSLYTEPGRGALWSCDLAVGFPQHPKDMFSLGRLERGAFWWVFLFLEFKLGQWGAQDGPFRQDDGPFDKV